MDTNLERYFNDIGVRSFVLTGAPKYEYCQSVICLLRLGNPNRFNPIGKRSSYVAILRRSIAPQSAPDVFLRNSKLTSNLRGLHTSPECRADCVGL